MGGLTPGSVPTHATEIYQEGLRLPPLRLAREGVMDAQIMRIIARNIRTPDAFEWDLNAQISACTTGAARLAELAAKHGAAPLEAMLREQVRLAEAATRAIPSGPARCGPGLAARRPARLMRPRTWFYATAMTLIGAVMLWAFVGRTDVAIEALRDRSPLFVRLADGSIRNSYTLKVSDRRHATGLLAVTVEGLPPGAAWQVLDRREADSAGRPLVETRADGVAEFRLFVTTAPEGRPEEESTPVRIRLVEPGGAPGREAERAAVGTIFLRPRT